MQISHKHKFVFFSFPKTGSESVRKMLGPYADIEVVPYWNRTEEQPFYSHMSPAEVKEQFEQYGWEFDDYFRFTFVRNPWARLVSLYNMIYRSRIPTTLTQRVRQWVTRPGEKVPAFKEWLESTHPDGPGGGGPADQRWQVYGTWSIATYILDEHGRHLVDDVIKLEEIGEKLHPVLARIGIPSAETLEIPFVNKGKRQSYTSYYDDESSDWVSKRYRYDIEQFGYQFGD
ncbi:MAG: sulfotransferase family 2 domain-containing protein [Pseudomonadota bacterium]